MRLNTRRLFGRLGIYDRPFRRMSSGAGSRGAEIEDPEDFPECWTAAAVIEELTRILSGWRTFSNVTLRRIAGDIERDMLTNPRDFARDGIAPWHRRFGLPAKNKLFLLLDLDDIRRFPFDAQARRSEVCIWAIGLTRNDFEHWERATVLMPPPEISEEETQVVLAILKLHQRLADIQNQSVPVFNYNRNVAGPGDGGGGGGGPRPVANLNFRSASLPRALAPMRAMLSRL